MVDPQQRSGQQMVNLSGEENYFLPKGSPNYEISSGQKGSHQSVPLIDVDNSTHFQPSSTHETANDTIGIGNPGYKNELASKSFVSTNSHQLSDHWNPGMKPNLTKSDSPNSFAYQRFQATNDNTPSSDIAISCPDEILSFRHPNFTGSSPGSKINFQAPEEFTFENSISRKTNIDRNFQTNGTRSSKGLQMRTNQNSSAFIVENILTKSSQKSLASSKSNSQLSKSYYASIHPQNAWTDFVTEYSTKGSEIVEYIKQGKSYLDLLNLDPYLSNRTSHTIDDINKRFTIKGKLQSQRTFTNRDQLTTPSEYVFTEDHENGLLEGKGRVQTDSNLYCQTSDITEQRSCEERSVNNENSTIKPLLEQRNVLTQKSTLMNQLNQEIGINTISTRMEIQEVKSANGKKVSEIDPISEPEKVIVLDLTSPLPEEVTRANEKKQISTGSNKMYDTSEEVLAKPVEKIELQVSTPDRKNLGFSENPRSTSSQKQNSKTPSSIMIDLFSPSGEQPTLDRNQQLDQEKAKISPLQLTLNGNSNTKSKNSSQPTKVNPMQLISKSQMETPFSPVAKSLLNTSVSSKRLSYDSPQSLTKESQRSSVGRFGAPSSGKKSPQAARGSTPTNNSHIRESTIGSQIPSILLRSKTPATISGKRLSTHKT